MKKLIILFLFSFLLFSRNVSYPSGWTVFQKSAVDENHTHIHYSPSAFNSYGIVSESSYNGNLWRLYGQWNHLFHRQNTKISQWNVYTKFALGSENVSNQHDFYSKISLETDWETRRYFIGYGFDVIYTDNANKSFFEQNIRLGYAPYLGEVGDFHTWFMLQVTHAPEREEDILVTPLVRFFKGDYLVELGANQEGQALFNFIIRY